MNNQLTQAQLAQLIAEVDHLSRLREAELDREQVQQILQELSLPPDLLDDALVQISRRQALAVQRRRQRAIAAGIVVVLIGAIATTTFFFQRHQNALSRVSAYQSHISLNQDNGGNLTTIERQTNPTVYYRVTLQDAPIGEKLSLTCDWIDPNGQVAHQNRYSTREINKVAWQTYCFYQFNQSALTGNWQVKMSLDGRTLSSNSLLVK